MVPITAERAPRSQLMTFVVGPEEYAMEAEAITSLASLSASLYMGEVADDVVDLRRTLGVPAPGEDAVVISVRVGERRVDFVTDGVRAIVSLPADEIEAPPPRLGRGLVVTGIARLEGRRVPIVDLRKTSPLDT